MNDDELIKWLKRTANLYSVASDPHIFLRLAADRLAQLSAGGVHDTEVGDEEIAQAMYVAHYDLLADEDTDPTWTEITERQRDYYRMLARAASARWRKKQ
jgi:hypothetical protein